MAYTIPEYVDTQEQAILAVASAVKGEQATGGDGSVNTALDLLADALAGENVQVPMTQQGAILALAQYVDGMVKPEGTVTITENGEGIDVAEYALANVNVPNPSTGSLSITENDTYDVTNYASAVVNVSGGGVDVGAPTLVISGNAAPEVGGYITKTSAIAGVTIGETTIVPIDSYNAIFSVASGATATTRPDEELSPTACTAYVVTVDDEEYTAVTPWNGTLTQGTFTTGLGTFNVWTFDVPALVYDSETWTGQVLYLYMH